jgi:hypothetical protein
MTPGRDRVPALSDTAERLAVALVARAGLRVTADIADIFEAIDAAHLALSLRQANANG